MKNNKRPTIKDIAQLAGVSHVTVSQALRDFPSISDATKANIRRIADEIGYSPNLAARNLALKTPNTIGMIIPSLGTETAYNEIINHLSELAAKEQFCLLLGSCNRSLEMEAYYCKMMCENMVGALIVSSCSSDISHIKNICDNRVPVIYIGGKTGTSEDHYIFPDYYQSGQLAVTYLVELGHRDIALFLYHPDNDTIQAKLRGYTDAMKNHSLHPTVYWNGKSSDTYDAGFTLTQNLIHANKLPTAIWCASDLMAYGVLEALKLNQIEIGKNVSVMGHDDLFFSEIPSNSLTTFTLPKSQIASLAMEYAKTLMQNAPTKKLTCKSVLSPELIIRQSTGPLLI